MKKLISFILAICLLLSVSACGGKTSTSLPTATPGPVPDPVESPRPADIPAEDGFFEDVQRGDNYWSDIWSELRYAQYDLVELDTFTAPLYDMAESGGTAEEFADLDYALRSELEYIYLIYQVADLALFKDPGNNTQANLLSIAERNFYDAYDEYFLAMSTVANSPYANIMLDVYSEEFIEGFKAYDPEASAQQNELLLQESSLVSQYYALMSDTVVDYEAVTELFVELVKLRNRMVTLAGYDSYADYAYYDMFYRDYGPDDAADIWAGVKEHFAPLVRSYQEQVWDSNDRMMAADLDVSSGARFAALETVLPQISPELTEAYGYMRTYALSDISRDSKKAQMGFTTRLYYINQPYMFDAPYGEFYDYMTLFHEFGHYANACYTSSDLLFGMADMDLSELQSQGMEMLFTRYYDGIFGEYADDAEDSTLMSMIYSVVDGAMYDEFLQRVYSEPDLTAQKVLDIYTGLYEDYGYTPYPGYGYEWVDIVHNFEYPFYYISYGVSALGALEIYEKMQSDWPAARDTYLRICAMDTEMYYFSDAISQAGLGDVFDPASYEAIAAALDKALKN